MAFWTWWPGDTVPALRSLSDFKIDPAPSLDELIALARLNVDEIGARLEAGNRCYTARIGDDAVGYGWVAAAKAEIGELHLDFQLVTGDRYLWDFQTLPAWRGHGVYPLLLQSILRREGLTDFRFWIINAPENVASARGIHKAGFRCVGDLAFTRDGRVGIVDSGDGYRAPTGAGLLGVPLISASSASGVSPCWCCIIEALQRGLVASCWPTSARRSAACTCGGIGRPGTSA